MADVSLRATVGRDIRPVLPHFPSLWFSSGYGDSLGSLQYVSHYCDSVWGLSGYLTNMHECGHAGRALRSHRKGVEHWGP